MGWRSSTSRGWIVSKLLQHPKLLKNLPEARSYGPTQSLIEAEGMARRRAEEGNVLLLKEQPLKQRTI